MRTISLRVFRAAVSDPESFDEPISVAVRRGGELVTLGTWTPSIGVREAEYAIDHGIGVVLPDREKMRVDSLDDSITVANAENVTFRHPVSPIVARSGTVSGVLRE